MKVLDAFRAGWEAACRYHDHEWGPQPPNTPEKAKAEWLNTCNAGHTIRVDGCLACKRMELK